MAEIEVVSLSEKDVRELKSTLLKRPPIYPIADDFGFSSLLISYGIAQEVGSANDELARFLFDSKSGEAISKQTLKAQVIRIGTKVGARIFSTASSSIEVRIRGFRDLCHPGLSENSDGSFHSLVIFPEIAAQSSGSRGNRACRCAGLGNEFNFRGL